MAVATALVRAEPDTEPRAHERISGDSLPDRPLAQNPHYTQSPCPWGFPPSVAGVVRSRQNSTAPGVEQSCEQSHALKGSSATPGMTSTGYDPIQSFRGECFESPTTAVAPEGTCPCWSYAGVKISQFEISRLLCDSLSLRLLS